jgi:aquaporin Z
MPKYLVEFIGTFFLVATIGFAVRGNAGPMAPVAIGSALMVMIFAGGHISGAHFNPAVTLAVCLRGKCPQSDVIPYWIAQVAAAALAAGVVYFVLGPQPDALPDAPPPQKFPIAAALLVEFLYTFALCYVVLNVATAKATAGNSFYGLAIGFTVLAAAYSVGNISGGAFNPAVAVGITILNLVPLANIWIFLVANFAAAVCAALAFKAIHPGEE